MSKKIFSDKEQQLLKTNMYVLRVTEKAITYTDEFKTQFISEHSKGKPSRLIFEEAGFDVEIIGIHRIKSASKRWRKAYKEKGILGLRDTRKGNSGRPLERELSSEEIIEKKDAEIAYLKAELELVKKLELKERLVIKGKLKPTIIYSLITSVIKDYKLSRVISHLCKVVGVSRSGYYRYQSTENHRNKRNAEDQADFELIYKAFTYKNVTKGSRGIYMVLKNVLGVVFNRKKIQRLMRKFELVCPVRRANPYKRIAKATKEHSVVPNLLERKFKEGSAAQILLTDITYIPLSGSFAYLSAIKDSVTNEILAYHLSKSIKLELATETIEKLLLKHGDRLTSCSYIHSDQGSHYTSPRFQKQLKKACLGQSMSRRGNCWDNAPMESFFGHMKDEVNFTKCSCFEDLELVIDEYIDYYNNYRFQWSLKKLTPVMYRNQLSVA